MSNHIAPIALFTYKRLEHLKKTVASLKENILASQSELIIFSDGPKDNSDVLEINQVRNYLRTIDGFKKVVFNFNENNVGLAKNIIDGVDKVVNEYGSVIVVEDDLISSKYFLQFMNDGLNKYQHVEDVISIHGYCYPIKKKMPNTFFLKGADCWGWATWKRGWDIFENDGEKLLKQLERNNLCKEFNFNNSYDYVKMLKDQIDGKNNSWAIKWYASAFLNNKLTLYPGRSLILNIGTDGSGYHGGINSAFSTQLCQSPRIIDDIEIKENVEARKEFEKYLNMIKPKFKNRIISKIKNILTNN